MSGERERARVNRRQWPVSRQLQALAGAGPAPAPRQLQALAGRPCTGTGERPGAFALPTRTSARASIDACVEE
ncbi:hypothetical protein GCM10009827_065280 [Dactylosporangium maewongense]|uniref:Uncharacterized protein n=1 Tax=Dactylosporangium maewongense TaxID=634393 RepID=A0ABP4M4K6_9ACTN